MFGRTIARLLTIFIVLLLIPVQVAAQQLALTTDQTVPPPPKENPPLLGMDIRFDRYSNDQGLSMSVVNAIAQDRQGFLWFATQDGLNRYDGYKFRIFKHDPEIFVAGDVGMLGESFGRLLPIDVTEGDDVFLLHTGQIAAALPAAADSGDVESVARGDEAPASEHAARDDRHSGSDRRGP